MNQRTEFLLQEIKYVKLRPFRGGVTYNRLEYFYQLVILI